jgi:hypothetical protein
MLRFVILGLFGFIALGLLIVWVLNGGLGKLFGSFKDFSFTGATATSSQEGGGFALPWQPSNIFPYITEEYGVVTPGSEPQEAPGTKTPSEYEQLMQGGADPKTYGNPSPLFRHIRISAGYANTAASDPAQEYFNLEASYDNTAPISLTGWSLQSAVSGIRVPLSLAAETFRVGEVNMLEDVSLPPGGSATVVSGISPVGVSFRENKCTGYLAQFQTFEPSLSAHCPAPSDELPLSEENLVRYGEECVSFARTLPSCTLPQHVPTSLSPTCRTFVQTAFSYNGCVDRHSSKSDFATNSWRLYLGSRRELWKNEHDAVRLLDAEGRTVDVYVY